MDSCRDAGDLITSRNKNNDLPTYINQHNKYIFDTSDINTDDRPLRRTLHLPVLCSAKSPQFTQTVSLNKWKSYVHLQYMVSMKQEYA